MNVLLGCSAAFCGFMSLMCVFGQLFAGRLLPTACAMALSGGAAAVLGLGLVGGKAHWARPAMIAGALGVLSVAADAAYYYKHLAIPGNYYGWGLFGPFAAALAVVAISGARARGR